jgi:hypothetical protein
VQTQVDAIWQKRLVLKKMSPTPPFDPPTDAKSPSGFRSPYGRGCYLLPTSPIKAMPLVLKILKKSIFRTKAARGHKKRDLGVKMNSTRAPASSFETATARRIF